MTFMTGYWRRWPTGKVTEKETIMLTRVDMERRERENLAPYAAKCTESRGRANEEAEHRYRTAYQRDRDRIVHSTAFRRLEYKTQVFLTHEGDHFRTRLTHTMEVAQIARTIARALNLNEDLTEAVALGHDLGHTPFGHSGEEVLNELMKGHGGFEHNRHSLRVVDVMEHPYPQFSGLNLTFEVRQCIAKHTTSYDRPSASELGSGNPPLEGQVVDAADAIAYNSHDLDDALAMGIIAPEDLQGLDIFRRTAKDFAASLRELTLEERIRRTAKLLIDVVATDLIETATEAIEKSGVGSTDDVRSAGSRLVHLGADVQAMMHQLEEFLMKNVYNHRDVSTMTAKAKRVVEQVFEAYCNDPSKMPPKYCRRAEAGEREKYQVICDYIAGMTDRYARGEHRRLFDPSERV